MHLVDVYRDLAVDKGDAPAITYQRGDHEGRVLTWGDLVTMAEAIAADLEAQGVGPGTRCAVSVVDHPNVLPLMLAVWMRGAVAVLMDPQWGETIRSNALRHSRSDALVTVGDACTVTPADPWGPEGAARPDLPPNTAVLAYTSGSTGSPKAIPLCHDRLVAGLFAAAAAVTSFRGEPPVRVGSSMRLSGFGVMILHYLWSAAFGAEVVVLPELSLATAGSYWTQIERHAIDQAVLVPALYELLIRASHPGQTHRRPLYINSSGPLSAATQRRFHETFGALILNCHGLTEGSAACTVGDTDTRGTTTNAIGRPFLHRVRLRGADGKVVEGVGEGELELSGPAVSHGYYDNEEANRELFDGAWLRTGDLARRDEDGKYWIVGRLKDAVMKGGTTVYLTEVEDVCLELPGVVEAVAVRLDMPGGNEDIGLIVRTDDEDLQPGQVKAELVSRLGAHRAPRGVAFVSDPLPRLGQNKIDRRASTRLWKELVQ